MKPESLGNFLSWRPPHITELISSGILIPQGKMIIFGPYKSWKSMTAIDLSFKMATGTPWLGFRTTLSTVLVIQLEIPKAEYQKRVNKYSCGNKLAPLDNLFFVTTRTLKLDKSWGQELLEQWISETKAQIVIIDPIFKVSSGRLTDEYDVRQLEDRLDNVIEKHGVSIVLIHHEGKDWVIDGERYDRGADASFGSVFFGAWVDSHIELRAESEGSNRVVMRFPLMRLAEDEVKPITIEISRSNLVFRNRGGLNG